MIKRKLILTSILGLIIHVCQAQEPRKANDLYKLSGTIAQSNGSNCEIFTSEKRIAKFPIGPKKKKFDGKANIYYTGLNWFGRDSLLALEKIETGFDGASSNSLVVLNMEGKVIERIITNDKYIYTGASYPSPSKQKLLLTSYVVKPPKDKIKPEKEELLSSLNPASTLKIMDYPSRKIALTVENFSKEGMLVFDESPWSPDEKQFVYTIQKQPLVKLWGEEINEQDTTIGGSYIFDLIQKRNVKFIPGSYQAIWSPKSSVIAYLKKRDVWLYDTVKDNHTFFIGSNDDYKIDDIHFTPDGEYLYIQCVNKGKKDEKIYRIKDGQEIAFKKINLKNSYYTWQ